MCSFVVSKNDIENKLMKRINVHVFCLHISLFRCFYFFARTGHTQFHHEDNK